jgi:hypothetical protein
VWEVGVLLSRAWKLNQDRYSLLTSTRHHSGEAQVVQQHPSWEKDLAANDPKRYHPSECSPFTDIYTVVET